MNVLNKLKQIEERIEECYIHLADLENSDLFDSELYNQYIHMLTNLITKEKELLISLDRKDYYKIKKEIDKDKYFKDSTMPIVLGHFNNAYLVRIENMINALLGDDYLDYASVLNYDINQLLISFLNELINDSYYQDIKEDLIYYKYNLIFNNYRNEEDFFMDKSMEIVNL